MRERNQLLNLSRAVAGILMGSALSLAPLAAFAAYNDVTLQTSAVLSVNGIEIDVTGSSAAIESIVVNASSFDVHLQSGSTISMTAPNRNVLSVTSDPNVQEGVTCSSAASTLGLTATGAAVVTVTPSTSLCSSSSGYAYSGSSGSNAPHTVSSVPTPVVTPPPVTGTSTSSPVVHAAYTFTTRLSPGMTSADVRMLQQALASNPTLYPEAIVTGYYGALTQRAVERFQSKYGVVSSGTPETTGYGLVGPATLAKLNEVFGSAANPAAPASAPVPSVPATVPTTPVAVAATGSFGSNLSVGAVGESVRALQVYLNAHGFTVAESGPGSAGNETTYFGPATKAALAKFQDAHAADILAPVGLTAGNGYFGPSTRAYVNSH